ncbi:MAG: hypothetical protein WA610_16020 [Thermodesulfovibrionales bacterium]
MIGMGIAVFSIVSAMLSWLLLKRLERFEKAELASYILLIVWGSFLFGLSLTRLTDAVR